MSSPIDLCGLGDVRNWLSINSGLPGNSSQTSIVSTTVAASLTPGNQAVTPASVTNIVAGMVLSVDVGVSNELVVVTAVSMTTFTANFALSHTGPFPITDQTDALLSRLITAASSYILYRSGFGPTDGSAPTQSPFTQSVPYNEFYDGNGNDRLFLRNYPITAVSLVTINGITIPSGIGQPYTTPGYVIDQSGKCLAFRSSGYSAGGGWFPRNYSAFPYNYGNIYQWTQGTQNINVQYSAGYAQTPYALNDACIKLVGYNYRTKRDAYGIKQIAKGDAGGSTTYETWIVPPDCEEVIRYYSRKTTA